MAKHKELPSKNRLSTGDTKLCSASCRYRFETPEAVARCPWSTRPGTETPPPFLQGPRAGQYPNNVAHVGQPERELGVAQDAPRLPPNNFTSICPDARPSTRRNSAGDGQPLADSGCCQCPSCLSKRLQNFAQSEPVPPLAHSIDRLTRILRLSRSPRRNSHKRRDAQRETVIESQRPAGSPILKTTPCKMRDPRKA
jgi:hypothetical protein